MLIKLTGNEWDGEPIVEADAIAVELQVKEDETVMIEVKHDPENDEFQVVVGDEIVWSYVMAGS